MRHRGRYHMCWLTAHERGAGASPLPACGPVTATPRVVPQGVTLSSAERARTLHALAGDLRRQRGPDGLPARRADRGPPRRASSPGSIDVDEAARMLTVVMSGLISLQLANEPGVPYSAGRFSSLTAAAVDMYLTHHRARLRASCRCLAARPARRWARASKWSTRSPGTGRGRTPRGDGVRAAPPLRRQPDRAFAGTLVWSYEVEPDDEGTLLTESHEVTRPVGRIGWLVIERLLGAHDRGSDLRRGIANPGRAQGDGRDPAPGPGR
jgi:hypothetical protein